MSDLATDRVYAQRGETTVAFVAAGAGVVAVELSVDRVGRFRFDRRCTARDVAGGTDRVAVATDEDVLLRRVGEDAGRGSDGEGGEDGTESENGEVDPYEATGHGPAAAVGLHDGRPVAATPDGTITRRVDGEWVDLGKMDAPVRAVDGPFVAAGDGVYRITPDGIDGVGLDDARDVAAPGPYVATGTGLYELGNGWLRAREGAFDAVAADPDDRTRAHAAAGPDLYARGDPEASGAGGYGGDGAAGATGGADDADTDEGGTWVPTDTPDRGAVVGIAHAPATGEGGGSVYAVTGDGTVLAGAPEAVDTPRGGWRSRSLGVPDVGGIAIPRSETRER